MTYNSISTHPEREPPVRLLRHLTGNRNEADDLSEMITEFARECSRCSDNERAANMGHLWDIATSPNMLAQAIRDIDPRRLFGSVVDEMGHTDFMNSVKPGLRDLSRALREGTFDPGEYRSVKIPKIGKSGTRTIEVPDEYTRIVARSVSNTLLPIVDLSFKGWSFWSRPRISLQHAMAVLGELTSHGYCYLVTADIADAFGVLPRKRAFEAVSRVINGSKILGLVELLSDRSRKRGVPQGLSTSPLIMNTYLDQHLDTWWRKEHKKTKLLRYADDILIACKTLEEAKLAYDALLKRMKDISMPIKQDPMYPVFHPTTRNQAVRWLGLTVWLKGRELQVDAGDQSWEKLEVSLENYRYAQEADKAYISDQHATCIAYSWFESKAIGFTQPSVSAAADWIRDTLDATGFDPDVVEEDEVQMRWHRGQELWKKAGAQAREWVRAKRGVLSLVNSGIEPVCQKTSVMSNSIDE